MTPEELDDALQRLRLASERVGSNLLELELDANRRLLDDAPLEGASAQSWTAAAGMLMQLWEWHGLLDANLDRAVSLRGTRSHPRPDQMAGLEQLLCGQTIELVTEVVPLERRDLLGSAQATVMCSADELLELMSARFDQVKGLVARFAYVWHTLEPRIHGAEELLAEATRMAADQADAGPLELGAAAERLAAMRRQLGSDPLALDTAAVDRVEQSLSAAVTELAKLTEFRRSVDRRLDRAGRLLAELREAESEAEAARAELLRKIASPPVSEAVPPRVSPELEAQLAQVHDLCSAGAWRLAGETLGQWTQRTEDLLDQTRRLTAATRRPIVERNRLRGLLDAYRAKAAGLGMLEDDELGEYLNTAQDALYTAPTDLDFAAGLVDRYRVLLDQRREVPA